MIYLLHGTDFEKARKKLQDLLGSLVAKKPDAEVFRIDDENFDASHLEELPKSQGLFEKKYIVVLDRVFINKSVEEEVLQKLPNLKESENIFIIVEGKLNKNTLSRIEKQAERVQNISIDQEIGKEKKDFNIFSLTDAFGKRDKKNLWVLYQKALINGSEPEEIHGIILWQLRSMLSARISKSEKESGLKPFVFKKSLGFSKNYSEEELKELSSDLMGTYHDSRRGIKDFATSLEKFILNI